MPKFNGEGPYYCKNCGGGRGIHRATDMACPINGEDQTGGNYPSWLDTYFNPQDYLDFVSLKAAGGRALFDDYFLAALAGVSTIFGANGLTQSEVDELFPDVVITCAFDVAKAAMKKREEYFAGKAGQNE
jgi:hypothetical protein